MLYLWPAHSFLGRVWRNIRNGTGRDSRLSEPAISRWIVHPEWFDQILDQMKGEGIKVILDIGGSPAPIWLHDKYPSVNVVNKQG